MQVGITSFVAGRVELDVGHVLELAELARAGVARDTAVPVPLARPRPVGSAAATASRQARAAVLAEAAAGSLTSGRTGRVGDPNVTVGQAAGME